MIKNYIKITLRNLLKNSGFTFINISGLTLGLTICLIIFLYVRQELSYDNFHANSENTYRVLRVSEVNGEKYPIAVTSSPFADALQNDYPQDIKSATRVIKLSAQLSQGLEKHFIENNIALVDSNFLETFNFPLAQGDKTTALALANSMIITKEVANKYFGDEDPMNKTITIDNQLDFIVTGIFAETTNRSHLEFDFVANWAPLRDLGWMTQWWSNGVYTYITLNDNVDPENLKAQFPGFMDKYFGEQFKESGSRIDLTIEPLEEIYFQSDIRYDEMRHGDLQVIYIFIAVAIFIFTIACINFMNLATARSVQRAKEVGVRKALGSSKKSLVVQFFMESFFISGIAVVLAFTVTEILLPTFNQFYSLDLQPLRNVFAVVLAAISLIVFTGFISGLYPALVLSSFKTVNVIKGKLGKMNGGSALRKGLVVLQFGISIVLIVFTLIVRNQLNYMSETDLGFNEEKIVLLELNYNKINKNIDTFMDRLRQSPRVSRVSLSSGVPGGFYGRLGYTFEGFEEQIKMRGMFTDEDFIPTYEVEVVAGRNFSKELKSDMTDALILNEKAVKELGWTNEEAINKRVRIYDDSTNSRRVIGVVKNYHYSSLKLAIEPLAIGMTTDESLLSIKLNSGGDLEATLTFIEDEWSKFVPFKPDINFLDQRLEHQYSTEQLQVRIFQLFAAVSIFVACLGIFGLASFTASQRRKEIGVRKVLGASVQRISGLLATDYIKMVLIASVLAIPLSWYLGAQWLAEFAYKIDISPLTFVIGLVAALLVAGLSVTFQSLKAAMANPVDVLKEE